MHNKLTVHFYRCKFISEKYLKQINSIKINELSEMILKHDYKIIIFIDFVEK